MSTIVLDILNLPSLTGAEVVAGHEGLTNTVSSVTVLEYAESSALMRDLFREIHFPSNEIAITSFCNIKNDVDAQCQNIQYCCSAGIAGIILYYVGIIIPEIDDRIAELCDELSFPLICMPKNCNNLRYSEAISEITGLIAEDQSSDLGFADKFLSRAADISPARRSMNFLLHMLSDQLRLSVFITDSNYNTIDGVTWPRYLPLDIMHLIVAEKADKETTAFFVQDGKTKWWVSYCTIEDAAKNTMYLFLVKEGGPFKNDILMQSQLAMQTVISSWSGEYGKLVISELVQAIAKNETGRMYYLAHRLNINIGEIHNLCYIRLREGKTGYLTNRVLEEISAMIKMNQKAYCSEVIYATLSEGILFFTNFSESTETQSVLYADIIQEIQTKFHLESDLFWCSKFGDSAAAKDIYLDIIEYSDAVTTIYNRRKIFSYQDVIFAKSCSEIVLLGDLQEHLVAVSPFDADNSKEELLDSIEVFLLDTESSVGKTAEILNMHPNSVKYRIQKINNILGYDFRSLPNVLPIYTAVSLRRLMKNERFHNRLRT
jgi:sugar diacid utilization regulator